MEEAALHVQRLGHQIADDLQVVHIAVGVDHAKRLHVRLLQHVVELVGLVHRVHRDHDHADLRRGVHEGEPIGDVARPHAQVVARLHADGQEALGQGIGALVEVLVGPAQVAVRVHDELVVGVNRHLLLQVGPNGQLRVQRIIRRPGNGSLSLLFFYILNHSISLLTGSPEEVSEGSTGACICAERRLSVLRYAKASLEVQRQVPVGSAASA